MQPARGRQGKGRQGAWPRATGPVLGAVEATVLSALLALRVELAREPTPAEIADRVGLRDVRRELARLADLGFDRPLSPQQEACLEALAALDERLGGRSPTTLEVSEQMGLCPSASRYHINTLVAMGLVTPPERRLVLSLTPHGRAHRRLSTGASPRAPEAAPARGRMSDNRGGKSDDEKKRGKREPSSDV